MLFHCGADGPGKNETGTGLHDFDSTSAMSAFIKAHLFTAPDDTAKSRDMTFGGVIASGGVPDRWLSGQPPHFPAKAEG